MTVRLPRLAGQQIVVNDAVLQVGEDGCVVGIVALAGQPLDEPQPLRDQDLAVLRAIGAEIEPEADAEPAKPTETAPDLSQLTKAELMQLAKERGIEVPRRATKRELIGLLSQE